ncbi:deoxyguanosinetriphosphate triphosphohydrolase [Sedimentibacter sp. MB31-C6]|uniref:deoxyguanosinetriphosphate triphosphohydrolase n=1 Tax=Sedimentibacter sp. MB31-C6 TaxID=3109366 RepID=UPI002DDD2350|nr:deoxyguanosinetriphosphate triphosphohydrolase [Sedimentibacter sp. MB36-C1]WSI04172.1 deoxyguanosinetriphosphate triphosphohydrolase [Sedimentibacter sp. MB36-C1]
MNIRESYEQFEIEHLSSKAAKSRFTKGRKIEETKCEIRTDYQRDRDRIIHSKAFRRLKHKTQVFLSPEKDHYRTRLTHTLEVSQISRTIARSLKLNEDLTEAIALGHDLGHTPFGHTGERILNDLIKSGFKHNEQSLRVVDFLEIRNGKQGLNLTYEVRDGILKHPKDYKPETLEGQIVSISDRIAYINHDIDDAIRANIINQKQIPDKFLNLLGNTHGERINTMIINIIENSKNESDIKMSEEIAKATSELRDFLFENVYYNKIAKSEEDKTTFIVEKIFEYYINHFDALPDYYLKIYNENNFTKNEVIKDYIAGMTDNYAMNIFEKLYIPKPWQQ